MGIEQEKEAVDLVNHLMEQGKPRLEAISHAWHRYGISKERLTTLMEDDETEKDTQSTSV